MIQDLFESYFITSPCLYGSNSITFFKQNLEVVASNYHIQKASFRESMPISFLEDLVETFSKWCWDYKIEGFLNLSDTMSSIFYAKKYGLAGVHIKGTQISTIENAMVERLKVFYSAHCDTKVLEALSLGADFVTLSPIFPTPHKGTPLGIKYLNNIDSKCKKHLFALGGILTQEEIKQVKLTGVRGFASIRYFTQKRV